MIPFLILFGVIGLFVAATVGLARRTSRRGPNAGDPLPHGVLFPVDAGAAGSPPAASGTVGTSPPSGGSTGGDSIDSSGAVAGGADSCSTSPD